uniref:Tubulin polyglutamylase ttll6 n=2 Tax=Schistocephalus solidus TaxID=70667 RepID=A0A0X3PV47_SCHSO
MDALYQGNEAPELVPVNEATDEDHSYFTDLVYAADEDEKLWKPPADSEPMLGFVDQIGTLILPPEDGFDAEDEGATTAREEAEPANPEPTNDGDKEPPNDKPEKKKKRRKRNLDANLTNCRYEAVRRVSRRFGFREVGDDEECNLYWTDFSVSIERVVSMKKWQKVNHFPGMSEICRKDCLARNLNRMFKLFPKDYNIFPKTWTLPADWGDLQQYARLRKNKTYILKPDSGCQGRGIWITKTPKDIKPTENLICQVYLSKPFLIDGFKFDLRLYVLVTSITPLRIFVFKDGLARFTTMPYRDPTVGNVSNVYMHLTNYAVQKHSEKFVRDSEEAGTKRRITTVNCWLIEHGYDIDKIWEDIDDVIIKVLMSGLSVLRHNYKTCFPQHVETSACFEILGFDIMLDRKLRPYVIEVNHSPSFHTDAQIDKEIKEALIWDTLQLANFAAVDRRKCVEEDRRRIKERLLKRPLQKSSREVLDRDMEYYAQMAETYENEHLGNFRRIFPSADSAKYDKFLTANASLYQETAAFKARFEYSKQLREEIRQRKEKLEAILKPKQNKNASQSLRPESPGSRTTVKPRRVGIPKAQPPVAKPRQLTPRHEDSPPASHCAQPIVESEESERIFALEQREIQMRNLGIIEAVHTLLSGTLGVIPTCKPPALPPKSTTSHPPPPKPVEVPTNQTHNGVYVQDILGPNIGANGCELSHINGTRNMAFGPKSPQTKKRQFVPVSHPTETLQPTTVPILPLCPLPDKCSSGDMISRPCTTTLPSTLPPGVSTNPVARARHLFRPCSQATSRYQEIQRKSSDLRSASHKSPSLLGFTGIGGAAIGPKDSPSHWQPCTIKPVEFPTFFPTDIHSARSRRRHLKLDYESTHQVAGEVSRTGKEPVGLNCGSQFSGL